MIKNDITIEHIMPQTLTQQWKDALGDNREEIYGKYLHTFANLTLTGYNSQYGNHSFTEKKEGYVDHKGNQVYGFKDSAFRLSNYLKTCERWTLDEIQAREQILQEKFLALWPMISSDYVPLQRVTESVSFNDDDLELTGRKIVAFTYNGVRHQAWGWSSMLEQLCKLLYADNPTGMGYPAQKGNYLYSKNEEGMAKKNKTKPYTNRLKQHIQKWNVRELKRQMKSMLFHRLALSRSKEEVLELAREGQVVQEPRDLLKDPFVWEFVDESERKNEED